MRIRLVLILAVLGLLSWSRPGRSQTFTKITDPTNRIVTDQTTGYSGAAWVDIEGDGDLDLFVNNGFLYRNDGGGTFVRLATTIGEGVATGTGNGISWADYDNDGDLDVYIASTTSHLYRNDGSGTFTRVDEGVIGEGFANRGWSPAWADFDLDGNVDLAVTHPAGFVPPGSTTNHLFRNQGPPDYSFARVTDSPITTGLSSYTVGSWSDFDGDGDPDYFVGAGPANGTLQPDFLYRNLFAESGAADFERITMGPLATDQQDGQLWNWVDHDNDGDLDGYLTNWGQSFGGLVNRLYRNDGGAFTSVMGDRIVADVGISLSSVWADFDNDGDLDCFVANDSGRRDAYYRNEGDGTFTAQTNALTESRTHRGASAGDFDGDGDLDLFVDGPNGNRSLFRNDSGAGNHWLMLRLVGVLSNRSAIGAKVRLRAWIGGVETEQLREISSQNTFNGHDSLDVHFGLGDATHADLVTIEWPSGIIQTLRDLGVDRLLEVVEASSPSTPPIPDGRWVSGEPLRVEKAGRDLRVTWDAVTCAADAVNVYSGLLQDFSTFTGAACDLPPTGEAVLAVPETAWLVVATADGLDADGSYGRDSNGLERSVAGASSACPAIVNHRRDGCP